MHPTTQNILSEITARLVNEYLFAEIYFFGFSAWGQPDDDRGMELFAVIETSLLNPVQRTTNAYRRVRGTKIPVDVPVKTTSEIDVLHRVHASRISSIPGEGTLIYG